MRKHMKKLKVLFCGGGAAALLSASYVTVAGIARAQGPAAPSAAAAARVDNFRLPSADLESYELYRMKDAKAVVLLTHSNACASAAQAAEQIKALKKAYAGQAVEFLMINSSPKDSREASFAEYQRMGSEIPILMDYNQLVGEGLNVTVAGEAIVIDPKTWRVAYRGALDATNGTQVLDAVAQGKPVPAPPSPAAGCPIDLPLRGKTAEFAKISYAKDIAPILEQKCVTCHQPGAIGPMSFTSYSNVKGFAPMIRETIRTQRMPPYSADPTIGHFDRDMRLSGQQIKTLVHWIEAGAPRGEGADPLTKTRQAASEWPLGKPDLIVDVPAYTIPATGIVEYQRPWIANPLTEGRWLRASTFKVGARQAVHHILTGYLKDVPTGGQANESAWGSSMGSFAVGAESEISPDNIGIYIPPGGAIGFQNHYTPYGKEVTEKSQIAMYFYPKGHVPEMVMRNSTLADPSISIAPGAERHKEVAYMQFPHDAVLYSAFPHAHYRGNSAKLEIIYPNGKRETLLALPRYDFNWQRFYDFKDPIKIPAGSKLVSTFTFDNSPRNPANPDPKRVVPWGDQSYDEMHYMQFRYRWVDETSKNPVNYTEIMMKDRMFGALDDNIDGKLQQAELKGSMANQLKTVFATLDKDGDGALNRSEVASQAGLGLERRQRTAQR
jgi:hypothetical protein